MRLDRYLVERGDFSSREKARRAVLAGAVHLGGMPVLRPSSPVGEGVEVRVEGSGEPFVSRGGRKLAAALDHFAIDPEGLVCFDVGASTGGFTDCLLQRGARRVYAADVGEEQMDPRLRCDPRVVVMDGINVRYLREDALPEPCQLITVDLSFISLTKVVPALLPHLAPGGWLLPLIKPQFEVGPEGVGKGGIVRDGDLRWRIVRQRAEEMAALGLELLGVEDSPVAGAGGNREAFACLRRPEARP